jgi:acyl dehydratase
MAGGANIYFEDVMECEELPSFEIKITRTHIIKYAGASGDFTLIHHDEEFAKSLGLPSILAMGMMHGGMLSRVVTDWAGDGRVKRYKIRFTGLVWPNDVLTFKGQVIRKYQESGENLVDCQLSIVNQKGENTIFGEATVLLPLKASQGR